MTYKTVWLVDWEFRSVDNERHVEPVCVVAYELFSRRTLRLWRDLLGNHPPYDVGEDSILVAYSAAAELSCHLALGWPLPSRVLDLYFEFRNLTSGVFLPYDEKKKRGLLVALTYFGLSGISALAKEQTRALILRPGDWTEAEKQEILGYCESDVIALKALLPKILPRIKLPYGLYRGRFASSLARQYVTGIPIDTELFTRLETYWPAILRQLRAKINETFDVYAGDVFRQEKFAAWLQRENIAWPVLDDGKLSLEDNTFRALSETHFDTHPQLRELRFVRQLSSRVSLRSLALGSDGFARCFMAPFGTITGRNAPSNSRFIFGFSKALRGLIKPPPGYGIAYLDWGGQEIGVAAGLSRDVNMMAAYRSGEAYLWFAVQGKLAPKGATKASHPQIRTICKRCMLAVNYGMGAESLAAWIKRPVVFARHLLSLHHQLFPRYWEWVHKIVNFAMLHNWQASVFGWVNHIPNVKPNACSAQDFLMQANGSEIMRLACCLATESGLDLCCSVHDALMIIAPLARLDSDVQKLEDCMAEASRIVLRGFELFVSRQVIRYPDRYLDEDGREVWETVLELLGRAERGETINAQMAA